MRISESCAKCLYDKQKNKTNDEAYLAEIQSIIDNRRENDTSPYLVYLFNKVHTRMFGQGADYKNIKKKYNDLVLDMEDKLRSEIDASEDPLAKAIMISRIGNYIDFGAMNHVDEGTFLGLFDKTEMCARDIHTFESFKKECEKAKNFLLICDNCGEIVLDKLLVEELKKCYPDLTIRAMVRGGDVLNDATRDDAAYSGMADVAEILDNGEAVAGTVYELISDEAKKALDESDVILAKGQGNYESMYGQGIHAFYMFLCKCDLFERRFDVSKLTGIFVEE